MMADQQQPIDKQQPAPAVGPSQQPEIDVESKAIELLSQGKRAFFVHDNAQAVTLLEEAVRLFDKKFGINADQCGEGYFYYGLALFNQARAETSLLVNNNNASGAQTEEEDDEDDEEGEGEPEDEAQVEETKADATSEKSKPDGAVTTEADYEEDITHSPKAEAQETVASTANADGSASASAPAGEDDMMTDEVDPNQPSTSSGVTDANRAEKLDEEEDDDEGSNLEVSFEVLTMAKNIFQRQLEYRNDVHGMLAEAAQKLGEILIEWENYEQSLGQFSLALQIRREKLSPDDRLIAETCFTLGLALSSMNQIPAAQEHIQQAIMVIQTRIQNLQAHANANPAMSDQDKLKLGQEIEEMQKLLPDMQFKLDDLQNLVKAVDLVTETAKNELLEEQQVKERALQNLNKPITDLTHMVKRKRQDDDDEDTPVKRRYAEATNGSNLHANGHNGNPTNGKHEAAAADDVSMVE